MKRKYKLPALLLAALLISLIAASAVSAAEFEGTLEVVMSSAATKTTGIGYLKGTHFKLVPSEAIALQDGVEGYPLIDFGKKVLTLLAPKDKYYLDMPMSTMEKPIDALKIKIKPSGKTDSILGHMVEEWVLDDASKPYTVSVWVTKDFSIGFNMFISLQKASPNEGLVLGRMGKELVAQGYFPLKAQAMDKKGLVTIDWQVRAINPKSLDEQEFVIPEGYVKMSEFLKKNKKPKGR